MRPEFLLKACFTAFKGGMSNIYSARRSLADSPSHVAVKNRESGTLTEAVPDCESNNNKHTRNTHTHRTNNKTAHLQNNKPVQNPVCPRQNMKHTFAEPHKVVLSSEALVV